jgi:hypothetical protein
MRFFMVGLAEFKTEIEQPVQAAVCSQITGISLILALMLLLSSPKSCGQGKGWPPSSV